TWVRTATLAPQAARAPAEPPWGGSSGAAGGSCRRRRASSEPVHARGAESSPALHGWALRFLEHGASASGPIPSAGPEFSSIARATGWREKEVLYAVDHFRRPADPVAPGHGQRLYHRRVHSHPAAHRAGGGSDSRDPGPQAGGLRSGGPE